MTKQEIEREISELNIRYNQKKSRLENELFELEQLEKEKQCHIMMKREDGFYTDIFKHLLQLEKTYCKKGNGDSCDECKLVTEGGTCIKNWLINEFGEFVRQAKKGE